MEDIDIFEKILGPDVTTLKGKTVRNKPKSVVNDYIGITQELNDTHQNIELCADIMYIQRQIICISIYKRIKFIAIQDIIDGNFLILNKSFDNTFRVYNQSVLQIQRIHVDTRFKPM